jgi:protein-disulfide isomerase
MGQLDIAFAFTLALTLGTAQCGRATDSNDDDAPSRAGAPAVAIAPAPPPAASAPTRVPSDVASAVRVPIDGLPLIGSARALVTIVAFMDYECPYSAKADTTIAMLRADLGEDVRIAFASHALPMHDHAPAAARAFLAAVEQGKGEAMHTRLFADRAAFDDEGLTASARAVGLDVRAWQSARTGASTSTALERAATLATSLGVNGTPTFFVNGRRIVGARTYEIFRALVEEERAKAASLVSDGIAREQVYATLMAAAPIAAAPARTPSIDETVTEVAIENAPARGPREAQVTVALFSDFECPYCVKAEATLRSLEAAYPGRVKVVFKHRPLPMHEHARLAAKASLAAEAQGRFWEYHDVLVAHRDALDRVSLEGYARTIGLDLQRFTKDIDDPRFEARINADEAQAQKLHVEGTPTAFVNGRRVVGAQTLAVYREAVDRALAAK